MRRHSYKYLFLLNIVFVLAVTVVCVAIQTDREENRTAGASITTPLIYADSLSAPFCQRAGGAVLIDAKSGAVLFEKNAQKRFPMASTTKIMTALVVIENSSPDDVITVSKDAAGIEGSSIYLVESERITVRDLLYGLLLESGNDAAEALAIGVFGSSEKCVEAMNEKCKSLGLLDTHFDNAHGLDSDKHYTTPYELAYITKHAMENDLFRSIVSAKSYVTSGEKTRYFSNHNRLLNMYSPAVGVKTGYTSKSGRCLVSAGELDGEEYIAVTLNDPLDWQDHKDMLSFAFENFRSYEIADKNSFCLRIGFDDYVSAENVYITTTKGEEFTLNYKITIEKGAGCVHYSSGNMSLGNFGIEKVNEKAL